MEGCCIIDSTTFESTNLRHALLPAPHLNSVSCSNNVYAKMLKDYPDIANGMVERFHRHMKTTFKAMASGPDWMGELPWVLLGIHTALKDDLAASSAELAYGVPLTVPGDFIPEPRKKQDPPLSVLSRLRGQGGNTRSCLCITTRPHTARGSGRIYPSAPKTTRPSFEHPFMSTRRQLKPFIIDYGGRHETVSVDRLKPAHLDFDRCSWRNPALEGYHYDMRRHALRLRSPDQDVLLWRRPDRLQYSCCGGRGHAAHQTTESSNCGSTNLSLATETPPRSVARALSSL
ncbi:hypothetical protein O3P69_017685 [Scylla paramamosain]|uniref:Uncharacterized protein n=1 Tax=Scylla paramamosain TaxID=85552 RepID=A0AAW0TX05_SCYPA